MSVETNASSGGGQGPSKPSKQGNFVEDLFGPYVDKAWIGSSGDLAGEFYTPAGYANLSPNQAHYMGCAIMRAGAKLKTNENFEAGILVVLDDVVSLQVAGNPKQVSKDHVDAFLPDTGRYVVETSRGNYQYGWRIKPEYDFNRWCYFHDMMKADPVYGESAKQGDPVHYFRTDGGVNPKKGNFKTRLVQEYDGYEWDLDELAAHFGIDMSDAAVMAWAAQKPKLSAVEYASHATLVEIMDMIPNDAFFDDRNEWAKIGFALKNASQDDPETRDLWIEWDRVSTKADAERFWDTARDPKAGLSTLRKEVERRYPDSQSMARVKMAQLMAKDPNTFPDDLGDLPGIEPAKPTAKVAQVKIRPRPYVSVSPASIPHRDWLYPPHYIRKFVFGLVSPGGAGKTSLTLVEAAAMASGKDLLGVKVRAPMNVWVWNGEDPREEIERRMAAIELHYGIGSAEFGGRLSIDSGRETKLVIAQSIKGDIQVNAPLVKELTEAIKETGVDVMIIDPFVSCHQIPENSNDAINAVVDEWRQVAEKGSCAVVLVHHVRKPSMQGQEITAEDARGASAFRDAVRGMRVVNVMDQGTARKYGITRRKSFFRTSDGKVSMAPARDDDDWYRFQSVGLGNGVAFPLDGLGPIEEDRVGVVERWTPTAVQAAVVSGDVGRVQGKMPGRKWRYDKQSPDWIGTLIGREMGINVGLDHAGKPKPLKDLDTSEANGRREVSSIVNDWVSAGWLKVSHETDNKGKDRPIIEIDTLWKTEEIIEEDDLPPP